MRGKTESNILKALVYISATITVTVAVGIVWYIISKGFPHISLDLFAFEYTSENCSIIPALINTLIMVMIALILAVPIGIFSAIYMVEYAKRGNKLVSLVRITSETLTGIPSIVYGLFGYLMFVNTLGFGYSILAGALTLAIMILPVIMRTTEEALISVPDSYREGSFGLGAGKLRTVFKVVLPPAIPGILSGVILSTGRIIGETAALIFTAGTVAQIPDSPFNSGRTLAIHLYALWNEGLNTDKAYATAVVLLVMAVVLNIISSCLARTIGKGSLND